MAVEILTAQSTQTKNEPVLVGWWEFDESGKPTRRETLCYPLPAWKARAKESL